MSMSNKRKHRQIDVKFGKEHKTVQVETKPNLPNERTPDKPRSDGCGVLRASIGEITKARG